MLVNMRSMGWSIILVIFVMMAQTLSFTASEDCSPLCATTCDINGNCICAQYPNSTGAIHFLGGEYCNQSSFYCNGSASPFWCAVNGLNNTCSRAPDGNFTCSCRAGFSGVHCELSGTACGDGYCYNGAACTGGGICDCPDDWQGSANCSISTPEDLHSSGHHGIKWWGALLLTGAIVAGLSLLAVAAVKKYRDRREGINRFKELQKSQMRVDLNLMMMNMTVIQRRLPKEMQKSEVRCTSLDCFFRDFGPSCKLLQSLFMLDREWQVHPGAFVGAALVIFVVTLSSIVGMWNVMPASKLWVLCCQYLHFQFSIF